MRETILKWGLIDKETRIEEDYSRLERLRKPADNCGKLQEIDRMGESQILIVTVSA